MTTTGGLDPLDLLGSLVLDDGRRWGELAMPWQVDDARAVLDARPEAARLHFLTRPRGGSKTTDTGGVALVSLLTQAPARSVSYCYARDQDQAQLLLSALTGLAQRSGLLPLLDVGSWGVGVRASGARLSVESADAASALGRIPYFVSVDELAAWPSTRGAKSLWEAIVSGLPKRRDSRLVVLTTAGDPAHWSASVLERARTSPRWRVSEVPGPLPWADPDDLAEQRRMLPESSYARLHENRWVSGEDRLVRVSDLRACVTLSGPLEPDPRHSYVVGVDLGVKSDRTVIAVCHGEPVEQLGRGAAPGPRSVRVVLDRMEVLQGTRDQPVELASVEQLVQEAARAYRAPVRIDPWQAIGLAQRLRSRNIDVREWAFTAQSVGRLALNLHLLLREHRLALPDDPALLDELANVRLRETAPGVFRLDHDSGKHDDRAAALGLAALALTERPDLAGQGRLTNPARRRPDPITRTFKGGRPELPARLALRQDARAMPPGMPGGGAILPGRGKGHRPPPLTRRRW